MQNNNENDLRVSKNELVPAFERIAKAQVKQAEETFYDELDQGVIHFLEERKLPQGSDRIAKTAAVFLTEGMRRCLIKISSRFAIIGAVLAFTAAVMGLGLVTQLLLVILSMAIAMGLTALDLR